MSQCKPAAAHHCCNLGAFSLWCVYRGRPGLSPFSRVDGNHTMFLERENAEKVMRGRESVYKVPRAGALQNKPRCWRPCRSSELSDPLKVELSPKPPCKQEAGLS